MKKLFIALFIVVLALAFVQSLVPHTVSAAPLGQAVACEQDVTVQAEDYLTTIAEKAYGSSVAFPAIVEATNQQNAVDDSYARIDNPDIIAVGWKLCVPSGADAETLLGSQISSAPSGDQLEFIMVQHALCAWDAYWCIVNQGIEE